MSPWIWPAPPSLLLHLRSCSRTVDVTVEFKVEEKVSGVVECSGGGECLGLVQMVTRVRRVGG
jgi:hypothetical protein